MDSPNHTDPSCWHVIRLELATPSRSALQKKFAELNCSIRQLGLDEHLHGTLLFPVLSFPMCLVDT